VGKFGLPPDVVAWCALAMALLWLLAAVPKASIRCRSFVERHYAPLLAGLCVLAALLSLGYVAYYLRGGPRIIDATAYWYQARVFASGHVSAPPIEPSSALRGRFLYFDPDHGSLAALFPPGYPALLSLGFLLGSPLAVGAVVAALLVWSTAALTLRLFRRRDAALLAGLFSATAAVLRYHTADTMSHGVSALLVTTAIYATLPKDAIQPKLQSRPSAPTASPVQRARPNLGILGSGLWAGITLGWLVATRPVTGAVLLLTCLGFRLFCRKQRAWIVACGLGLLPGLALWLGYQQATTGSFLVPTQVAYYAVADGPPGCFRYGFGKGIGCWFEHGSYVDKRLAHGFGLLESVYVTILRLRWHCLDVHNFEPLAVAVFVALAKAAKQRESRLLVVAILAVVVGYMPFYFDASYPGGGARLFVDVIALEHALVAGLLVQSSWPRWFVPLSLVGFAIHGAFEHLQLRNRDGGRPMFEPKVLAAAGVRHGVVFVDTDHGFLLGHDPLSRDANASVVVLRRHGDAHDRVAWQALGKPEAFRYEFNPMSAQATPRVAPIDQSELAGLTRFEAESQWPVLAVRKGWVRPVFPPNDCTSARRGLSFEPIGGSAVAELSLVAEHAGLHRLRLGLVAQRSGRQRVRLTIGDRHYDVAHDALAHQCTAALIENVELRRGEQGFTIETGDMGAIVDYWLVEPLEPPASLPAQEQGDWPRVDSFATTLGT
jgi:hypothetical protein